MATDGTGENRNVRNYGVSMVVGEDAKQSTGKQDLVHLAILSAIALGIGVYLIATTVLISRDGVYYIEQAQHLLMTRSKL